MKVGSNLKPMLLTDSVELPVGDEWLFETKYDGFRCILTWEKDQQTPILKSRNNNVLNQMFPEIISFCESMYNEVAPYLPLMLDGELVYLTNNFQADFSIVQKRGKMRNAENVASHIQAFPCHYIVFDLLQFEAQTKTNSYYRTRKQLLAKFFKALSLPTSVDYQDNRRLQAVDVFEDSTLILEKIKIYNGEGIIAKKSTSKWREAVRTKEWLKIKNWRYVSVVLTKFDSKNGFFQGAIYKDDALQEIVTFTHGLKDEDKQTLTTIFKTYGALLKGEVWEIPTSICVKVACIDFDGTKLREPRFHSFMLNANPSECNWQHMQRELNPLPNRVLVTHPNKPVFPTCEITKDDYLLYLQKAAPYMLSFMQNRLLTVIRYPHGVPGESFYQKNFLENIPSFVTTRFIDETNYILCNNLETLLWLGNQLALEFHIPFQPIDTEKPTEIVFDLDPPSVEEFHLAVNAALKMREIFNHFGLQSFVKTSGGKGMQVYIPLPVNTFSYEETGVFTEFVCKFLVQQFPQWFTIERLKKNRGNRLYLDYVQHREGKTIIAPYSSRGNPKGLIATPLQWNEVNEQLKPDIFTMTHVMERIHTIGNPLGNFRDVGEKQKFQSVLNQIMN